MEWVGKSMVEFTSGNGLEPYPAQLVLAKSTDDGKTWSEPINITEQVASRNGNPIQGPGMEASQ